MTKEDPWFFQERAVAFASLVLTKHHNVIVRPQTGADRGCDLLVEIRKDGKPTLRFFGVQLVASLDLPTSRNGDEVGDSRASGDPSVAALPICVFVIGVRKPEGIYRWIVEPVVEDGRPRLERNGEANWHPLDEAGAERLIGQVNAWYDVLSTEPATKTPARHSRRGDPKA